MTCICSLCVCTCVSVCIPWALPANSGIRRKLHAAVQTVKLGGLDVLKMGPLTHGSSGDGPASVGSQQSNTSLLQDQAYLQELGVSLLLCHYKFPSLGLFD